MHLLKVISTLASFATPKGIQAQIQLNRVFRARVDVPHRNPQRIAPNRIRMIQRDPDLMIQDRPQQAYVEPRPDFDAEEIDTCSTPNSARTHESDSAFTAQENQNVVTELAVSNLNLTPLDDSIEIIDALSDDLAPASTQTDPIEKEFVSGNSNKLKKITLGIEHEEFELAIPSPNSVEVLNAESINIQNQKRKPEPRPTWNCSAKVDTPRYVRNIR